MAIGLKCSFKATMGLCCFGQTQFKGVCLVKEPRPIMNHKETHKVVCRICGVDRKTGHASKEDKEKCLKEW